MKNNSSNMDHNGVDHWLAQRASALIVGILIPVCLVAILLGPGIEFYALRAWMANPFRATGLLILIGGMAYHGWLGTQMVIEDYVAHLPLRYTLLLVTKFLFLGSALLGLLSILKIALV